MRWKVSTWKAALAIRSKYRFYSLFIIIGILFLLKYIEHCFEVRHDGTNYLPRKAKPQAKTYINFSNKSMNLKTLFQRMTILNFFFYPDSIKTLESEESNSCEGLLMLEECPNVLSGYSNDKSPGSDDLTIEFHRLFWKCIGKYLVDSFNCTFCKDSLSISQKLGIISLIPKNNESLKHLKNWRPISLLNTDNKTATKTIAVRLENILPSIIHPCQTGCIKGRYIGECIRHFGHDVVYKSEENPRRCGFS